MTPCDEIEVVGGHATGNSVGATRIRSGVRAGDTQRRAAGLGLVGTGVWLSLAVVRCADGDPREFHVAGSPYRTGQSPVGWRSGRDGICPVAVPWIAGSGCIWDRAIGISLNAVTNGVVRGHLGFGFGFRGTGTG
jgi:hypothetical protein